MSKLVILRGNSGSGKTALSKLLQKRLGAGTMRISHDMVRIEIMNSGGRLGVEKSLPLMAEMLKFGRENSEVTILEGILPKEKYLPLFEKAAELFDDEIYAYYYDISFEETLRRHRTKPQADEWGEEEMRAWWVDRDYLENISEATFDESVSLEAALERICCDLGVK